MFSNHEGSFCYVLWSKGLFSCLTVACYYLVISFVDMHVYEVCVQCIWVNMCVQGLEITGLHKD